MQGARADPISPHDWTGARRRIYVFWMVYTHSD